MVVTNYTKIGSETLMTFRTAVSTACSSYGVRRPKGVFFHNSVDPMNHEEGTTLFGRYHHDMKLIFVFYDACIKDPRHYPYFTLLHELAHHIEHEKYNINYHHSQMWFRIYATLIHTYVQSSDTHKKNILRFNLKRYFDLDKQYSVQIELESEGLIVA